MTFGAASITTPLFDVSGPSWTRVVGKALINPATGADTVTVAFNSQFPDQICGGSTEFNNVHQTVPVGTANTGNGNTGTALSTGNVTGAGTSDLLYGAVMSDSEAGITQGQTLLWERENIQGDTSGGAQYRTGTGSALPLTWTATTSGQN
jgi:hypothetical protein